MPIFKGSPSASRARRGRPRDAGAGPEGRPQRTVGGQDPLELAAVELAAGDVAAAEDLARAEAEMLLAATARTGSPRSIMRSPAGCSSPTIPITPPDPNGAYELARPGPRPGQESETLRARSCSRWDGRARPPATPAGRSRTSRTTSRNIPKGADRSAARYHLGEAQWHAGQPLAARLTWTDLARDLAHERRPLARMMTAFRARALYQIARHLRHPQPARRHQLEPGRGRPAAVPRRLPRPPLGRAGRLRDRCLASPRAA